MLRSVLLLLLPLSVLHCASASLRPDHLACAINEGRSSLGLPPIRRTERDWDGLQSLSREMVLRGTLSPPSHGAKSRKIPFTYHCPIDRVVHEQEKAKAILEILSESTKTSEHFRSLALTAVGSASHRLSADWCFGVVKLYFAPGKYRLPRDCAEKYDFVLGEEAEEEVDCSDEDDEPVTVTVTTTATASRSTPTQGHR